MATNNFTNGDMRRSCIRIKQLFLEYLTLYSEDIYYYFPSLCM